MRLGTFPRDGDAIVNGRRISEPSASAPLAVAVVIVLSIIVISSPRAYSATGTTCSASSATSTVTAASSVPVASDVAHGPLIFTPVFVTAALPVVALLPTIRVQVVVVVDDSAGAVNFAPLPYVVIVVIFIIVVVVTAAAAAAPTHT